MEIETWIDRIINGIGGFKSWEDHELVVHSDRDAAIAAFVIRALANPASEGSREVIDSILQRRKNESKIKLNKRIKELADFHDLPCEENSKEPGLWVVKADGTKRPFVKEDLLDFFQFASAFPPNSPA